MTTLRRREQGLHKRAKKGPFPGVARPAGAETGPSRGRWKHCGPKLGQTLPREAVWPIQRVGIGGFKMEIPVKIDSASVCVSRAHDLRPVLTCSGRSATSRSARQDWPSYLRTRRPPKGRDLTAGGTSVFGTPQWRRTVNAKMFQPWRTAGSALCVAILTVGTLASARSLVLAQHPPHGGIRGHLVGAWGNPPANPPTYHCVRVFDASGTRPIAEGVCSGIWAAFRVPLPPGTYVVEIGHRTRVNNGHRFSTPIRRKVNVAAGQWVDLSPRAPTGPVQ
jgi:hypothetical protein